MYFSGTHAVADFTPLNERLTFHKSGRLCVNVTIVTGDAFENPEKFSVVLYARDERIKVKSFFASVYIIEDGG